MNTFFFTVIEDAIVISKNKKQIGQATKLPEVIDLMDKYEYDEEEDVVMFSSSMNHPSDYTKNDDILNLIEELME